jgi:hypothetical protein
MTAWLRASISAVRRIRPTQRHHPDFARLMRQTCEEYTDARAARILAAAGPPDGAASGAPLFVAARLVRDPMRIVGQPYDLAHQDRPWCRQLATTRSYWVAPTALHHRESRPADDRTAHANFSIRLYDRPTPGVAVNGLERPFPPDATRQLTPRRRRSPRRMSHEQYLAPSLRLRAPLSVLALPGSAAVAVGAPSVTATIGDAGAAEHAVLAQRTFIQLLIANVGQ